MLYIFYVDIGTMLMFDMSLALDSVATLKDYIEQGYKIPHDKQVLLVSGGESLDETAKVCSYSAGTDTNPIFLFSKTVIESPTPPSASVSYGSDHDIRSRVEEAHNLPAVYDTVVVRAQLAQQLCDNAKQQTKVCERLVHDQHLQQQGWAAVIANLEDLTIDFRRRADIFEKSFNDYLKDHDNYLNFLKFFNDDLKILSQIPIIPALLENEMTKNAIEEASRSSEEDESPSTSEEQAEPKKEKKVPTTLLEWISSTDSRSTMDQLFEHCSRGLEHFDETVFNKLHQDVNTAIDTSNKADMKEVKGLGDRLYGLEQLMLEAKRYVREQEDLAQSFAQNQNRAGILGDQSILPDLCESHRRQLLVMLNNHNQLCDIRRRCTNAKQELSINLYHRLRWVMYVENLMVDANHNLVIYHDNLKRLRQHLEVLQQIHLAPTSYLSAVAEVVRRRAFSQAFLLWASELACHLMTIYNEEVARRKDFQAGFEGHFLNALFPGMEDLPPNFATQAPSIFDSSLPKISTDDVTDLKQALPDLTTNLPVPDVTAIKNIFEKFMLKPDKSEIEDDRRVEDKLVEVVNEVGLASNLDQNLLKPAGSETCLAPHGLSHLKDLDKGCESETDTEEFEKVCQSPLDLQFDKDLPSPRPASQDASTLTEVGDKSPLLPPKKPPRTFQKLTPSIENINLQPQRAMSTSGSNTESFTNIKNTSLESIDELSSLKNNESCYNSHHQQLQGFSLGLIMRSKSLSPHTPQSPRCEQMLSPNSPLQGHQPSDFVNEEYYIDESLPSSLSIDTGNVQGEYAKQLSNANDVVALLQENLETSRTEQERMKTLFTRMALLSRQAILQLRQELSDLKLLYETEKSSIKIDYESLSSSWENLAIEFDNKEKEIIHRLTLDHELELSDYKKLLDVNNIEVKSLRESNESLQLNMQKLMEENQNLLLEIRSKQEAHDREVGDLNRRYSDLEVDKEKSIKEVSDRLSKEHKVEVDNMRLRFRLMTLERSPSDSTLEKIEKSDVNHEAIILQMKENYEAEKLKVIEEVQNTEKEKWEKILQEKLEEIQNTFNEEKLNLIQDVSKRITEEKDRQILLLTERENNLKLECIKHKNTIQQLTECEFETKSSELMEKIEFLEREKCQLATELCMERSKRFEQHDMAASVAILEAKVDAATSPVKQKEKLTKSQTSLIKNAKLSIETCSPGDAVLILWNKEHDSYMILQENPMSFFLHTDCLETLKLKKWTGQEKIVYCTGEVIEKEFCHAKKAENRYKVPRGTKFYRVKVKPLIPLKEGNKAPHLGQPMTQSQTTGPSTSEQSVSDGACYSLPSTPTKAHYTDKERSSVSDSITESSNENR